ncbi:hypothetical protein C8R43DRAFT_1135593 [Mycena crocata]|nr:hypothetical protein C8R43DRAFT_1135593 [Mycena crocata]
MIILFLLSTIHIALAYAWAFITEGGHAAIYRVFSFDNNRHGALFSPEDPVSVHRIAELIRIRFALANIIADSIIIYRCYVICAFSWRVAALPLLTYAVALITIFVGLLPLSGSSQPARLGVAVIATFLTNVFGAGLTAGRIWWISRRVTLLLGGKSHKRYSNLIAIIIESGMIYPVSLIILLAFWLSEAPDVSLRICGAVTNHIVAIAPTLIIVRVGLGVSTDGLDKDIPIKNGGSTEIQAPNAGAGAETTSVLEFRVAMRGDIEQGLTDTKTS